MKKAILMAAMAAFVATPALANDPAKMDAKVDEKFMKMDTDGNGSISEAEFTAAKAEKFGDADTNGDGAISKDELKAAWKEKKEEHKDEHKE